MPTTAETATETTMAPTEGCVGQPLTACTIIDSPRPNAIPMAPPTRLVDQFYAEVQGAGGGRLDTSSLVTRLPK